MIGLVEGSSPSSPVMLGNALASGAGGGRAIGGNDIDETEGRLVFVNAGRTSVTSDTAGSIVPRGDMEVRGEPSKLDILLPRGRKGLVIGRSRSAGDAGAETTSASCSCADESASPGELFLGNPSIDLFACFSDDRDSAIDAERRSGPVGGLPGGVSCILSSNSL